MSTNYTNTISLSVCHALCVDVKSHTPVNVDVTLPYAVDVQTAEKPVRKALSKRTDVAFAMVTAVDVQTAVYEMSVSTYVLLCEKYGTIEAKNA